MNLETSLPNRCAKENPLEKVCTGIAEFAQFLREFMMVISTRFADYALQFEYALTTWCGEAISALAVVGSASIFTVCHD